MKIKSLLLCLSFFFLVQNSFADSPLTSTPFYKGYLDIAIIKAATKSKGTISKQQLDYLTDTKNPIAVKLALINGLGWNFKGQSNASKYISNVFRLNPKLNNQNFIHKASAEELICYAYLNAMDDYFNVKSASIFARQAMRKAPTSYSIHLIGTLIQVQGINQNNWCTVYTKMNQVRTNKKLKLDFKSKSIAAIYSYTDGYEKYCE